MLRDGVGLLSDGERSRGTQYMARVAAAVKAERDALRVEVAEARASMADLVARLEVASYRHGELIEAQRRAVVAMMDARRSSSRAWLLAIVSLVLAVGACMVAAVWR